MQKVRYNHLNTYLKSLFGERTLKICVDGDFTCPNRDGSKSTQGCLFCGEMGAGDLIKHRTCETLKSIVSQVNGFLGSYRGERANKFIVYFQSFSNTYDTIENLKLKYDTALACSQKIVGLEVATRPDCISEEVARLLASYKDKFYVCVELGLQTSNDDIGNKINRYYSSEDFSRAVSILHKYKIPVVAHLMVGLPDEKEDDILGSVEFINNCKCEGVKIHSTYVMERTGLEAMYKQGKYVPITQEYYVDMVAKIVSRLNENIVIHRINADPPKDKLTAPDWVLRKKIVINAINRKLDDLNITQGDRKY